MNTENLFSALSKYGGSQGAEDYLTEAFACLLRCLLVEERLIGLAVINRLCGVGDEDGFAADDRVTVRTQVTTRHGRPDMEISASAKLVYVEVKKNQPVAKDELDDYGADLDEAVGDFKRLVLLTRVPGGLGEHNRQPDNWPRWFEVHDWLKAAPLTKPVACYLTREFLAFLEVNHMNLERVGWELMPGLDALQNLLVMFGAALEQAGIGNDHEPIYKGNDYFGCSVHGKRFWCGPCYGPPLEVWFHAMASEGIAEEALEQGPFPLHHDNEGRPGYKLDLEDENVAFFALRKETQLAKLAQFIERSYKAFVAAEEVTAAPHEEAGSADGGREEDA